MSAILLAVLLAGCSASGDFSAAEKQVPVFHSMLDAGNIDAIYVTSSQDLKDADPEGKFDAFLGAVHRKLGTVENAKRINSGIKMGTSGTFVTLIYNTSFTGGDATETFVYRMYGGKALLAGHRINSDALIEK